MASVSDIISRSGTYENLIQQLIQIEGQKKVQLETNKSEQVTINKELGTISSKISTLENTLTEYGALENKTFSSLKTVSTDPNSVSIISSEGLDETDEFSINVGRLASRDHIISKVYDASGSDLDDLGDGSVTLTIGSTTKTFTIESGWPPNPGNEKSNEVILNDLASQLEAEFGDAVQATVFQTSTGKLQLSIRSSEEGYDSRVQVIDTSGMMEGLFTESTRQTPVENLNARFSIDGIQFERSSNLIDDTINGLTFQLESITENPISIVITQDTEKATSNFNSFMEAFNDLNKTIRSRTFINGETGSKGPLQGFRSIRNLSLNMRQIALIDADPSESPIKNLSEIGIAFEKDGSMKIEDNDLFTSAIETKPEELDQLFSAASSPITAIKDLLMTYTSNDGVIDSIERGVEQRMERLDNRIAREEKYLLEYEEQQRAIFTRLEQITEEGISQYNQVMSSLSNLGI